MRGLLLATLALSALAALPGAAFATVVPNVCQYSIDNFYREVPIGLSATPAINAAAPRFPAAGGTVVNAGQTITLDSVPGQPLDVVLPDNLQRFGYQAGLLVEGPNVLNVNVWVAIRATNTVEGVQIAGPLTVTASTEIETSTDDSTGAFVSATPFVYAKPDLPQTTWTATGGDVVFSQAEGGTLGSLPVGNGGAARALSGSVVIQAVINAGLSFYMDCRPGGVPVINPVDGAGPDFFEAAPVPIDASVTGPDNTTCISSQGRLATGPAANLPGGVTREVDAIGVRLSPGANPEQIPLGASYTVAAGTAQITLPADTVATLGRQVDGATPLVTARGYPLDMWITLAATNTAEGTQTVHASGTYVVPAGSVGTAPGAPGSPIVATLDLPATTWTPSGAGTIRVSAAQPRAMSPIAVTGNAAADPLGPVSASPYSFAPFGSIVLRAGTDINPVTLDCMPAAIAVADPPPVAFSNLGRTSAEGRYTIRANPRPDALATTRVLTPLPETPPPPPPPPPPGATPPPAAVPAPKPPAAAVLGPGKFGFTKLKVSKGRIKVVVSCAASRTSCAGTLRVRTLAPQRLTPRAKPKLVTIARDTRYTVAAGKLKSVTLTLSRDAVRLLRARRSVKVKAGLKPSRGASVTRTLNLTR